MIVYDSEDGEKCIKRLEFDYYGVVMKDPHNSKNGEKTVNKSESSEFNIMIELNEDGRRMYRGGYSGCPRDGYVRNGEGDEYDENDLLVYSGGWKKGMRDGNGILYDHSDVKYNGCWKDNKPNGKGKLYDKNGNVVHEGIWKNGYFMVSNNTGIDYESLEKKELYENGNVKYEGEWNGNVYEGWGVEYDQKGNIEYEGNWIKGIPNGYGKCYHKGKVYQGKWKNGVVLAVCHLCWFSYNNKKKTNVIRWWCETILDWLCQCGECIWDGFVSFWSSFGIVVYSSGMDFVIVWSPSWMVLLIVVNPFAKDLLSVVMPFLTRIGMLMEDSSAIVQIVVVNAVWPVLSVWPCRYNVFIFFTIAFYRIHCCMYMDRVLVIR